MLLDAHTETLCGHLGVDFVSFIGTHRGLFSHSNCSHIPLSGDSELPLVAGM